DFRGVVVRDREMNDMARPESRCPDRSHSYRHLAGEPGQHRVMRSWANDRLLRTGTQVQFGTPNRTSDRHRQSLIRNAYALIGRTHNVNRHQRFPRIRVASVGDASVRRASILVTSFRFRRSDEPSGSTPDIFAITSAASSISWSVKSRVAAICWAACPNRRSTLPADGLDSSSPAIRTRLAANTTAGMMTWSSTKATTCATAGAASA